MVAAWLTASPNPSRLAGHVRSGIWNFYGELTVDEVILSRVCFVLRIDHRYLQIASMLYRKGLEMLLTGGSGAENLEAQGTNEDTLRIF